MGINVFFSAVCGMVYQTAEEAPLMKSSVVLAYLLLQEDLAMEFGIGFMLGKWLMDLADAYDLSQEIEIAAALTPGL